MSSGLKNVCLTWPLPGASSKRAASTASTTTVLAVDSAAPRRPPPSIRERRADRSGRPCSGSPCSGSTLRLDRGDAGEVLQVLRGQLGQRPVALQRGQRLVDAGHERVALGEEQAGVLAGGRG